MEPTTQETTRPEVRGDPSTTPSSTGMAANVAGLLCYLLGPVTGIVFLVVERDSSFVRFHAVQSTVALGSLTVINVCVGLIPLIGWLIAPLLPIAYFLLWILLMVKAYQGERFALPIAGEVAERHASLPR